jgi:hypothetical protein
MWRTRHTFPHPGLLLTEREKGWQVLVAAGQQGNKLRRRLLLLMMMMVMRRKKHLMWKKSFHKPMSTWGHLPFSSPKILDGGKRSAIKGRQRW